MSLASEHPLDSTVVLLYKPFKENEQWFIFGILQHAINNAEIHKPSEEDRKKHLKNGHFMEWCKGVGQNVLYALLIRLLHSI